MHATSRNLDRGGSGSVERRLLLALAVGDEHARLHLTSALEAYRRSQESAANNLFDDIDVESCATLDTVSDKVRAYFVPTQGRFAIVLSDGVLQDGVFDSRAKALLEPNLARPLAVVAVTDTDTRITDIASTAQPDASQDEIQRKLRLITARLLYTVPPDTTDSTREFRVGRIADEFELVKYFRLRHKVYSIMGYMSAEKESVASALEIDGCDVNAIHLGAFERCDGYEELAGTARILLANARETSWADWTRSLLRTDRELEVLVRNEALPLGLPVFHSQSLNGELQRVNLEGLLCAELSRVIVDNPYRGAGLARELVEAAIAEATQAGVDRLYLECLPLHEALYGKFGFETIANTGGEVIGVKRSMIAMAMSLT